MKRMTFVLLFALVFTSPAHAETSGFVKVLRDYVLPCSLSMGAAMIISKNDGFAIGSAVCVGVTAATVINRREVDPIDLRMTVDASVTEKTKSLVADVDKKVQNFSETQSAKFDELRRLLREVLAERLMKMEDDVRVNLENKLSQGDILPQLEQKIAERIKTEVITESKARSREIISKCVEEVIRQVTLKAIALPDNAPAEQAAPPAQAQ
jgi:hypothetical protein